MWSGLGTYFGLDLIDGVCKCKLGLDLSCGLQLRHKRTLGPESAIDLRHGVTILESLPQSVVRSCQTVFDSLPSLLQCPSCSCEKTRRLAGQQKDKKMRVGLLVTSQSHSTTNPHLPVVSVGNVP